MLKFLKEWGWLITLAVVGVIIFLFTAGKKSDVLEILAKEKDIVDQKSAIRKKQAAEGLAAAKAEVEKKYAAELEKLDANQKTRATELAHRPDELVDALLRGTLS